MKETESRLGDIRPVKHCLKMYVQIKQIQQTLLIKYTLEKLADASSLVPLPRENLLPLPPAESEKFSAMLARLCQFASSFWSMSTSITNSCCFYEYF
jgi:hypothetical protein